VTALSRDVECVLTALYILSGGSTEVTVPKEDVFALVRRKTLVELKAMAKEIMDRRGQT